MATDQRNETTQPIRPANVVTYFGNYASAIAPGDHHVHIFIDGDEFTFCNLPGKRPEYGTPATVGQRSRRSCERCFQLAQEMRRDI